MFAILRKRKLEAKKPTLAGLHDEGQARRQGDGGLLGSLAGSHFGR